MLATLRWWADLLDSRFRIPGTGIRFGIDPLLSLIPGFGDLASPVFAVALLVHAAQLRVPHLVILRMVLNALVDALIGAIPVAGTIGDVFWRANNMNLALLERHARPGQPPSRGDDVFVLVTAGLFGFVLLLPVFLGAWLMFLVWQALDH